MPKKYNEAKHLKYFLYINLLHTKDAIKSQYAKEQRKRQARMH